MGNDADDLYGGNEYSGDGGTSASSGESQGGGSDGLDGGGYNGSCGTGQDVTNNQFFAFNLSPGLVTEDVVQTIVVGKVR